MKTPVLGVSRLRCENRRNPLGIDAAQPRLNWALESEERTQTQSAYQILVAGNEEDLRSTENLLWDSGKVVSSRSVGIEYGGEMLQSGSQCHWKVRVWDGSGTPSSYSEPASFEMGLLERSDREGTWISVGEGPPRDHEPREWGQDGVERVTLKVNDHP